MSGTIDFNKFRDDLSHALGLEGEIVSSEGLKLFLSKYFCKDSSEALLKDIGEDLHYFRSMDPASFDYDDSQILNVRRGMAAISAHRIFQEILRKNPKQLYEVERVAKYVQKDTNVEIHPLATIGIPFAIDHGHGTVIGATAKIGTKSFIYHGVTLGASGQKSATGRRHPLVGDNVFFGNGSQVLGPAILENNIHIASGVLIRDSYLHSNIKISMEVRIAGVVVPEGARIFGSDATSLQRYWVLLPGEEEPGWVEFDRFDPSKFD